MTRVDKANLAIIARQGGMLAMDTGWKGQPWRTAEVKSLRVVSARGKYRLYGMEGFRKYSRQVTYFVSYRYLCGYEDGQRWCIRVPGTIDTVSDALNYVTPAAVKTAQARRLRVIRQGDIYIIERKRQGRVRLPARHTYNRETGEISHPEHGTVKVDFPFSVERVKQVNGRVSD